MKKTSIGITLAIAMCASAARADDGAGAFRLSLSGDLFGWEQSSTGTRLRYGLLDTRLGIEVGGALTPEILIGVTAGIARTAEPGEFGEIERIEWLAQAWIEGAFLHGEVVRPFVRGSVGAGGVEVTGIRDHVAFSVGLTAGAHFFASDDVSISPWMRLDYQHGTRGVLAPGPGPATRELYVIAVTLGVSLAGWIGGGPPPERIEDAASERRRRSAEDPAPADTVRSDVRIPGIARARLSSRPRVDGRDIQLGFTALSATARFAGCRSIQLGSEIGTVEVPMRVTQQPFERGVEETVVLTATHLQLEILAGPLPRLIVCGQSIELDMAARASIGAYLQRFRSMAAAAGTLDAPVAVTAPPAEAVVPEPEPANEAIETADPIGDAPQP